MTTMNDAFINALLADATYALDEDVEDRLTGPELAARER